ncbi:hypothetical protein [Nocardia callitridis]|uniref:Uncharacterized protein n=1 Tax=Nocardia callitridis TaxID=648753 RepID=A0ABP9KL65_9NOCA
MSISREEMERIARELWGPTMGFQRDTPESRAVVAKQKAYLKELEEKGRRQATEEQTAIWQAWGDSEAKRIEQERGETPE